MTTKNSLRKVRKRCKGGLIAAALGAVTFTTGIAKDPNPAFNYTTPTIQREVQKLIQERPLHGREVYAQAERIVRNYHTSNNSARAITTAGLVLTTTGMLCALANSPLYLNRRKEEDE